jgi:hypothetical protein
MLQKDMAAMEAVDRHERHFFNQISPMQRSRPEVGIRWSFTHSKFRYRKIGQLMLEKMAAAGLVALFITVSPITIKETRARTAFATLSACNEETT